MKKISLFCFSIAMISALVMAVCATGKATFSLSLSDETVSVGEEVTLSASCSSEANANSYGLMLKFDENVFEVVGGDITVEDTLVTSMGANGVHGFVFMFQEAAAYSGQVGTMVLRVKETAPAGAYTVTGTASVKNGTESLDAESCSVTVTVAADTAIRESTAAGEPGDMEEIIQSATLPVTGNVSGVTAPAIGEAPQPDADSTLTIGADQEENDGEGSPAWIFLIAAGVIAAAGVAAFVVTKKKK